jgi:hypothetical protein
MFGAHPAQGAGRRPGPLLASWAQLPSWLLATTLPSISSEFQQPEGHPPEQYRRNNRSPFILFRNQSVFRNAMRSDLSSSDSFSPNSWPLTASVFTP